MTEQAKEESKRTRGIKVLAKVKLMTSDGVEAKKGEVITMSKEDIKHFGSKVTKDFDDAE